MTSVATLTSGQTVVLRDGSEVLIRPVQPADAGLLAEGFERLSPESRPAAERPGPKAQAARLR